MNSIGLGKAKLYKKQCDLRGGNQGARLMQIPLACHHGAVYEGALILISISNETHYLRSRRK